MKSKNLIIGLFLILCLSSFVSASQVCTNGVSTLTNGTDYFRVSTVTYNTTYINPDNLFKSWTFFTPRLNFSVNVSDSFLGGNTSVYSYIMWKNLYNFTPTLKVYNGTARQLVGSGNYSLRNISSNQWVLDWLYNNYTNQNITINFNKNFTKNVDDLVTNPSDVYIGATYNHFFVVMPSITTYGEDAKFQFNGVSAGNLGYFLNNTNWAVGWSMDVRTCEECSNSETGLFTAFRIVLIIIGLLILVTGLYLFKNGMIETNGLIMFIVGTIVFFVCIPMIRNMLLAYGC